MLRRRARSRRRGGPLEREVRPHAIGLLDRDCERLALFGDERRDELQRLGLAEIDALVHIGRLGRI